MSRAPHLQWRVVRVPLQGSHSKGRLLQQLDSEEWRLPERLGSWQSLLAGEEPVAPAQVPAGMLV